MMETWTIPEFLRRHTQKPANAFLLAETFLFWIKRSLEFLLWFFPFLFNVFEAPTANSRYYCVDRTATCRTYISIQCDETMENERLFVKLEMFLNENFFQWNLIEMMECENIAEFQQMNEVVRFDQLSERGTKKKNMSRILNSIKYQRDKKPYIIPQ